MRRARRLCNVEATSHNNGSRLFCPFHGLYGCNRARPMKRNLMLLSVFILITFTLGCAHMKRSSPPQKASTGAPGPVVALGNAQDLEAEIRIITMEISARKEELEIVRPRFHRLSAAAQMRLHDAVERVYPERQRLVDLAAQKVILRRELSALLAEFEAYNKE